MARIKRLKRHVVKAVKVSPDFSSSCLWDIDTEFMIEPRDLGLPCRIVNALCAFEKYYDMTATGRPSYCVLKRFERRLNEMGLVIAKDIKRERPDLKVEYWGEWNGGDIRKVKVSGARSSAGTEHSVYTRKAGSSNLPVPTKKRGRR